MTDWFVLEDDHHGQWLESGGNMMFCLGEIMVKCWKDMVDLCLNASGKDLCLNASGKMLVE